MEFAAGFFLVVDLRHGRRVAAVWPSLRPSAGRRILSTNSDPLVSTVGRRRSISGADPDARSVTARVRWVAIDVAAPWKSRRCPYAEPANDVGGVLTNPSIADKHRMTYRPADSVTPAFAVGHADDDSVDDDLPQAVADTISDLFDTPRARGWIHVCSTATAIVAGAALVPAAWTTVSPKAGWATLVYARGIVAMFGISAAYHRVHWHSPAAEMWMMRVDHSVIFVFIAASYTPFALLAMPERTGAEVMTLVWSGAAAGVDPEDVVALGAALGRPAAVSAARLHRDLVRRDTGRRRGSGCRRHCWSPAVCSTTSGPCSTACAGRTRGRIRSATTSSSTPSPRPRHCATTPRRGA